MADLISPPSVIFLHIIVTICCLLYVLNATSSESIHRRQGFGLLPANTRYKHCDRFEAKVVTQSFPIFFEICLRCMVRQIPPLQLVLFRNL